MSKLFDKRVQRFEDNISKNNFQDCFLLRVAHSNNYSMMFINGWLFCCKKRWIECSFFEKTCIFSGFDGILRVKKRSIKYKLVYDCCFVNCKIFLDLMMMFYSVERDSLKSFMNLFLHQCFLRILKTNWNIF